MLWHEYVHTVTVDLPELVAPAPTDELVNCVADIVLPAPPTVLPNQNTSFAACGFSACTAIRYSSEPASLP